MHAKVEELILQSSDTCEEYNTEIRPTYHTSLRVSVMDWERVIRGLKTTVLAILVNE
jgi:hypothetical protein